MGTDATAKGKLRQLWLQETSEEKWLAVLGVVLLMCSCASEAASVNLDDDVYYSPSVSPSVLGVYNQWAVSTDAEPCARVPRRIFAKNGTLADAAVATLLCMGVVLPHSMGIGGGFLAVVYESKTKKAWSLNAREKAPASASETMFVGEPQASLEGGKAIGVPGELRGYQALLDKMGSNLPWKDLFEDAIHIAMHGHPVHKHLAVAAAEKKDALYKFENMRNIFWNDTTNDTLAEGSLLLQKDLGETLKAIAEHGADYFYTGDLAQEMVKEVQKHGGILTTDDLEDYQPIWKEPIAAKLQDGRTLYSSPPPGSGAVLAYVMNIISGYGKSRSAFLEDNVVMLHRLAEASKFAYAQRFRLGDPHFLDVEGLVENMTSTWQAEQTRAKIDDSQTFDDPEHYGGGEPFTEDHGTAHACFWGPNGDAISVSSTINYFFGSFVSTKGVLLNNQMDDFSTPDVCNIYNLPPTKANFIAPGKRPMSSMAPAIFVNSSGGVDLIVGATGGSKIIPGIALVSMRNLWQGHTIKEAIDFPRLHHQLIPNKLQVEDVFPEAYVKRLEARGHECECPPGRFSIVMGVSRYGDRIHANADYRKGGTVDGE